MDGSGGVDSDNQARLGDGDQLILGDLVAKAGDPEPARRAVESFISAIVQSEHLNLLVGSGLTTALGYAAEGNAAADMTATLSTTDGDLDGSIEVAASQSSRAAGRGDTPNIEDRLRAALAAESGLRIVQDSRADLLGTATSQALKGLRDSVVGIESEIGAAPSRSAGGKLGPAPLLTSFLGSFAGRVPTRDRLHIFTTNYDRVLEWGAEQSGLRIVDRFVGSLEPVFRSSRLEIDYHYTPAGSPKEPRHLDGVVRLTKLHGSLDWRWRTQTRNVIRQPTAFGAESMEEVDDLLIYPNAAKDFETTLYPYADLFRDFSAAICRPNSTLVTYGYSFGDDHINRIIHDMLTIPSTHLLIIAYSDDGKRVTTFVNEYERTGQVSLMMGPAFGDLNRLTQDWLPRPATATITRAQAAILAESPILPHTGGSRDV